MMRYFFTVVFCFLVSLGFGQDVDGDYRSNTASGNWSATGSWERFDGVSWVAATAAPTADNAQKITIRETHTITINSGTNADQIIVESGGTLIVSMPSVGSFAIRDGDGVDLLVEGNFFVRNRTASIAAGAEVVVSGVMSVDTGTAAVVSVSGTVTNNGTLNVEYGTFNVLSGGMLTCNSTVNVYGGIMNLTNGSTNVNGSLNAEGGTLNITGGLTTVNGTINGLGSWITASSSNLIFAQNSIYNQAKDGTIPLATWEFDSRCIITDVSAAPSGLGQTFYNFIWDTPDLIGDVPLDLPPGFTAHNLTFANTGGYTVFLSDAELVNLSITGDLTYELNANGAFTINNDIVINVGGNFNFNPPTFTSSVGEGNVALNVTGNVNFLSGAFDASGTYADYPTGSGETTISIGGDYINSGVSILNSGDATQLSLVFNGTGVQNFTSTFVPGFPVNYSTANTANLTIDASSFLAGPGNLNVGTGTSISLLSEEPTGALQDGTTAGNVRVPTLNRTYSGTIVYAGANNQFISPQHPSTADTRINITNNDASLTMLGDITFSGSLDMADGELQIGANTLTIAGPYSKTDGNIYPSVGPSPDFTPVSSLAITGSGAFPDDVVIFSSNALVNFTIDRIGVVIPLGAPLTVAGTFTLTEGDLFLGANNQLTVSGPFIQTNGRLSVDASSFLRIDGTGALPADIAFTGSAINTIRMNRDDPAIFNTSSTLVINTLILASGSVEHSGGLSMADGGLISRTFGSLLTAVGNNGTYSLFYGGVNGPLSPELELPATAGVLQNFTVDNNFNVSQPIGSPPFFLTLNGPIDAAGDFVITEGNVITSNNPLNIGGNLTISSIGTIQPGTSTVTFDGGGAQVISSVPVLALTDVVVNKSGSTLTLATQMTISNSFAVNSATTVELGSNLLTLLSTSTATAFIPPVASGAVINGSVIAQRNLPTTTNVAAYRYLAPITTGSNVQDWKNEFAITGTFSDPSTGTGIRSTSPSMYIYDETTNTSALTVEERYVNYPQTGLASANPLENGKGYAVWIRGNGATPFDTRGGIRSGNFSVAVTNSGGTSNDGYNLIGNPYPAPIDWDAVIATNLGAGIIGNAIYLTDNTLNEDGSTRRVSYVGGAANPPSFDGLIAQGQGFWVHANAMGSVDFEETHKFTGQTNFLRKGEIPNLLHIKMQKGTTIEYAAIRLHEEATDDFDRKWDAVQFGASGLYISSLSKDNQKLAINSISSIGCDNTVPLQIDGAVTGSYTFDFTGIETFDASTTLYLVDKVLNKQVAISATPQYAFTVSDVASLKNRFEILVDRPSVETALTVEGESICENSELAYITLQNSQTDVNYSAQWNGQTLSSDVMGNGGQLEIPVPVENLSQGEHQFTILAKMTNCEAVLLENEATLTIVKKGVIERVEDGSSCEEGPVVIKAFGDAAELYNWYEDATGTSPISGQNASVFTTPVINKTKTYYVAAVNSMGCEGERVAVKANVTLLEDVTIEAQGTTLISSYETGNQWYLDGLLIENETTNQIEATISGTYSVVVSVNGCTTSAAREMTVTGISESQVDFITVYPNPATDKVLVEVKSVNLSLNAKLISPMGVELYAVVLSGESEIKSGQFDLMSYPTGMYMVQILDGKKVYTIKISKIK